MAAGKYREVLIEDGENLITFLRRPFADEKHNIDNHLTEVEKIEINHRTIVHLTDDEGTANIFSWLENGYWYMLSSSIDTVEMIKILENLK